MDKKFFIPTLIALVALVFFFVVSIMTKVYHDADLPLQIMGALLGAIITAFITMILLHGQSEAEELKERNVKVFEEKTKRYNSFINELWNVWEDRKITLEELNHLLSHITKDILIFTQRKTTKKILEKLDKIADQVKSEKKDKESQTKLQKYVFDIINILADEMNLGGKIDKEERETLNSLELKILPYLKTKEYKKKFLEEFNSVIKDNVETLANQDAYYKKHWDGKEYIFIDIGKSPVKLMAGPVTNNKINGREYIFIAFFVEFWENRQYYDYRDAGKGWRKDFLKNMHWEWDTAVIDFDDVDAVNKLIESTHIENPQENNGESSPVVDFANKVVEYYKTWNFNGENIEKIIIKCGDIF